MSIKKADYRPRRESMEEASVAKMSIAQKEEKVKKSFLILPSKEAMYEKIIALGSTLPPLHKKYHTEEHLVRGCQSRLYLRVFKEEDLIRFEAYSAALISAGLAALLFLVYDQEKAEVILTTPPNYIREIGILNALSSVRSNGLRSLYLQMQKETAKFCCSVESNRRAVAQN